jgi:hypothetical protein
MRLTCLLVDDNDRRSFELSSGQVAEPSTRRTRSIRARVLFINKLDIETTTPAYRRKEESYCRRVYSSRVRLCDLPEKTGPRPDSVGAGS